MSFHPTSGPDHHQPLPRPRQSHAKFARVIPAQFPPLLFRQTHITFRPQQKLIYIHQKIPNLIPKVSENG